jgi:site-specific DNA recombinase
MNIRKIRDEMRMGRSIYDLPLRVTFYARVSTDKLEQQGSLENQIQYYTDFIQKNPNWDYVPGYIDEGISGTSTYKRESFLRMIADAHRERFDFIITKEISRFSRNTLDSIHYTQALLDAGVAVLFQNDNINTLDSDSEFRLVVMAGVAQDEVRKLSERLKFGFRQSIKNGHVLGNDQLWGYDKKDCKLTILPEQAEAVRIIFELYATGDYGLRKLSLELTQRGYTSKLGNDFNSVTIGHILTNPKYKGWYCGNKTKSLDYRKKKTLFLEEDEWVIYPDPKIPAIVSEELWDRANALYRKRSQRAKSYDVGYQSRYAYSGKIICGKHRTSFHRQSFKTSSGVTEFWKCRVYRQKGKDGCNAPSIRTSELDAVLADIFTRVVTNKEQIVGLVLSSLKDGGRQGDGAAQIQRIEEQIAQLETKKDKLLELSVEDAITMQEFKQRNNRFNDQIAELRKQILVLQKQEEASKNAAQDLEVIKKVLEEEINFTAGISTDVVGSILDHVVVGENSTNEELYLEVLLRVGWDEFVTLNRNPFVFSISSSKNITHKPPIRMI